MYKEYEQKIIKLAKIRHSAFKHRFLIGGISALVVATTVTLITTKGIVSDVEKLKARYEYGENITYKSNAFMSSVKYEFATRDGEEWSEECPSDVGSYKFRSLGRKSGGSYYYGKTQYFDIVPKEIGVQILTNEMTYGDTPSAVFTEDFVKSDHCDTSTISYIYQNKQTNTFKVMVDSTKLKVLSLDGKDVTRNYTFASYPKNINILARSITIASGSSVKGFDGTNLSDESYTITSGSLVSGDVLNVVSSTAFSNIGVKDNVQEYIIKDENGLDVTKHYSIETNYGSLEIEKKPITFASKDIDLTYDGEDHAFAFTGDEIYIKEGSDGITEKLSVKYTMTNPEQFVRASTYENTFTAKIYEGDVDISSNYIIDYDYGYTTIAQREISVQGENVEVDYSGYSITNTNWSITEGSLADKDDIIVTADGTATAVGTHEKALNVTIVDKNTREDFTDCYLISKDPGTIKINKIDLEVKAITNTYTYDGKYHTSGYWYDTSALLSQDVIDATCFNNSSFYKVGTYTNEDFELTKIIDSRYGTNVLGNYNVIPDEASKVDSIVINKRPITINISSQTITYMGDHIYNYVSKPVQISSGSLADTDVIRFTPTNNPFKVSETPCSALGEIKIEHLEEGNGYVDVTDCYDITVVTNGTLTINKRNITVRTIDCIDEYDRNSDISSKVKTWEVVGDGLAEYESISGIEVTCNGVDAGMYVLNFDYSKFKITHNSPSLGLYDATDNYNVTFENNGILTIRPRDISVVMLENSKVYDGTPFTSTLHSVDRLLEGDYLKFYGLPSITHTFDGIDGVTKNMPTSVEVYTSEDIDVTSNYNITLKAQNIWIDPRPITITTEDHEKVFDGLPFESSSAAITKGTLADGDEIAYSNFSVTSAKHVDDSGDNEVTVKITNPQGLDVTLDYDITFIYGSIVIEPCPIEISLVEEKLTYDGTDHGFENDEILQTNVTEFSNPSYISDGELPLTYSLDMTWTELKKMVDVGTYVYGNDFVASPTYHSTRDTDIRDNDFDLTFGDVERYVVKRQLVITSPSGSKEFDGLPFDSTPYFLVGTLAPGEFIEYEKVNKPIDITGEEGVINPIGTPHIYRYNTMGDKVEVTYNYSIELKPGKVVIYEKD